MYYGTKTFCHEMTSLSNERERKEANNTRNMLFCVIKIHFCLCQKYMKSILKKELPRATQHLGLPLTNRQQRSASVG